MKNIKNLVLSITLATATLISSITLAISPHIEKNLCKYGALPLAVWTALNGISGEKTVTEQVGVSTHTNTYSVISYYKWSYEKQGRFFTGLAFIALPFVQLGMCLYDQRLPKSDLLVTAGGALAVGVSIAGIRYFNKQIEAQKKQ